jgi:hypothetical protein
VDNIKLNSYSISPIISSVSDHDVQFLTINIVAVINVMPLKQKNRKISNETDTVSASIAK